MFPFPPEPGRIERILVGPFTNEGASWRRGSFRRNQPRSSTRWRCISSRRTAAASNSSSTRRHDCDDRRPDATAVSVGRGSPRPTLAAKPRGRFGKQVASVCSGYSPLDCPLPPPGKSIVFGCVIEPEDRSTAYGPHRSQNARYYNAVPGGTVIRPGYGRGDSELWSSRTSRRRRRSNRGSNNRSTASVAVNRGTNPSAASRLRRSSNP